MRCGKRPDPDVCAVRSPRGTVTMLSCTRTVTFMHCLQRCVALVFTLFHINTLVHAPQPRRTRHDSFTLVLPNIGFLSLHFHLLHWRVLRLYSLRSQNKNLVLTFEIMFCTLYQLHRNIQLFNISAAINSQRSQWPVAIIVAGHVFIISPAVQCTDYNIPFLDWLRRQVMQLNLMSHARLIIILFQSTHDSLSINRYVLLAFCRVENQ